MNQMNISRETPPAGAATILIGALVHIGAPPPLFGCWGRVALWVDAGGGQPAHYVVHGMNNWVWHVLPEWVTDASRLERRPGFSLASLVGEGGRA